ncbi:hypothetical protein Lsha_0776 [Legionella shakespearei DSM 23087]|uniref:Uncharacterized protein n=1 Tax=Legionella shakespearei DSM 23087 TaxID=1122169 RepID=A0A0W0Z266_9GAMM|nr:hypothetical protein Lsha_0776 [Legionella shakespearei DSM 23087]
MLRSFRGFFSQPELKSGCSSTHKPIPPERLLFKSRMIYTSLPLPDPRRPERVFLREGSPEAGTVPVLEILRAKRRAQDDVVSVVEESFEPRTT